MKGGTMLNYQAHVVYIGERCQWVGILTNGGVVEDVVLLPDDQSLSLYLRDPWNSHFEPYLANVDGWIRPYLDRKVALGERDIVASVLWPHNALDTKPVPWPGNRPD